MSSAIDLKNIRYQYADKLVLDIPQATFEENISYAILGDNGSGKTTLLNLLSLINPLQQGEITLNGETVSGKNKQYHRQQISYVQQKPFLFDATVKYNIELPLKLRKFEKNKRRETVDTIIEQLSISTLINRKANTLSGGEQQKVAIARALVTQPDILLLDEPFSHLDKTSQADIKNILIRLKKNRQCTLIMALHDELKAHVLADHVLRLVNTQLADANIMNVFTGTMHSESNIFDTGKIHITLPEQITSSSRIAIDAKELVLSNHQLNSSMRNEYQGKIVQLNEYQGQVQVSIDAGENFQAIITHNAMKDLNIHLGDDIWLYFKSSIVKSA